MRHCFEDLDVYHTWHFSSLVRCAGSGSSSPFLLAHLIDLLMDDRVLSLHGVLDDLRLLHLH